MSTPQRINADWKKIVFRNKSWFEIGPNLSNVWRRPHEDGPEVCCATCKSDLHFVPVNQTADGEYYSESIILDFISQADAAHPE
jgi:hypothetical protein